MQHLPILLLMILSCALTLSAQTFIGPGPDPACDGTELKVVRTKGRITYMTHSIFASTRTVIEEYTPLAGNDWQITLRMYSSRRHYGEPATNDRLLRSVTFKASNPQKFEPVKEAFGYGNVRWADEPERLLKYFRENEEWFEEMKE